MQRNKGRANRVVGGGNGWDVTQIEDWRPMSGGGLVSLHLAESRSWNSKESDYWLRVCSYHSLGRPLTSFPEDPCGLC